MPPGRQPPPCGPREGWGRPARPPRSAHPPLPGTSPFPSSRGRLSLFTGEAHIPPPQLHKTPCRSAEGPSRRPAPPQTDCPPARDPSPPPLAPQPSLRTGAARPDTGTPQAEKSHTPRGTPDRPNRSKAEEAATSLKSNRQQNCRALLHPSAAAPRTRAAPPPEQPARPGFPGRTALSFPQRSLRDSLSL